MAGESIRPCAKQDAPAVVTMWNDALMREAAGHEWYLAAHRLTVPALEQVAAHPNYRADGGLVCEVDGEVVAYGRAAVRHVPAFEGQDLSALPAYLEGFVVDERWRGRGIGGRILTQLEAFARSSGRDAVQMNCFWSPIRPMSLLPGSTGYGFLLRRGYEALPPEMQLRLTFEGAGFDHKARQGRQRLREQGLDLRYYEDADRASFEELLRGHFLAWWHDLYGPNLDRPTPHGVLVALDGRRVVGFIGFVHVKDDGTADFTPGVHPDYRRRGIATALLDMWAAEVQRLGAVRSEIATNVENAARHIYFEMGYEKIGEFSSRLTRKLD
ncbi:MAG: GNAT family N-acetyltransferase [Candidatus Brocadiaceae bacterium]|nr:GNAT family N-acetyltransferase [Candidatus Brocadiaceae bacterium]